MKKIYALLFFAAMLTTVRAQVYHPLLSTVNDWSYATQAMTTRLHDQLQSGPCSYPAFIVSQSFHEYTTNDTLIGIHFYKPVESTGMSCSMGYIREDSAARKVFFIDNNSSAEHLLYDFSMQPGDTITINFASQFGYYVSGVYTLDSIGTRQIVAGTRAAFHLSCHSQPGSPSLEWIESVGNPNDVLYPYFINAEAPFSPFQSCSGAEHTLSQFMVCFTHAQQVFFDSCAYQVVTNSPYGYVTDSCDYYVVIPGGISETTNAAALLLSPNPSTGKTILRFANDIPGDATLSVRDLSGKTILHEFPLGKTEKGSNEKTIDLSFLANGVYVVELQLPGQQLHEKLLIAH